ncbi:MAG: TonB-dependent receptor [Bacteroidia bacterium]|nr:TonB-dependent receptor [Bacteroidia bacterium]
MRIVAKIVLLLLTASPLFLPAQQLTQTIRGTVADAESKFPLTGVTVAVISEAGQVIAGTNTNEQGEYRIDKVPLGRQTLRISFVSYQSAEFTVILTSAKEYIQHVELANSTLETVEIVAQQEGQVSNEMATVSARMFSIEETNRYAGSRGEPARMAANYAGVQGADDSRNDIVIRGNSPSGVLWRLEGINIPNPNHFAIPGTGGGPVTILNNKFLANSDFYTGAFPAEFANGIAGTFDLRMRNGNNEKREFSAQLGFLGTELMAEGPISREKGSSYLAMYRYSTLALFGFLGLDVGTNAIPQYQDGAFRLNFPGKNGSSFAIWGMGGISDINIILSEQEAPSDDPDLYAADQDRDQYFGTNTSIVGMTYRYPINPNTFVKASVALSRQTADTYHEQIFRRVVNEKFVVDSLPPILDYFYGETKVHSYVTYNRKLNVRSSVQAGLYADWYQMQYFDSVRTVIPQPGDQPSLLSTWRTRWDSNEGAVLLQPFVQYKLKLQDRFTLVAGVTSLYFGVNDNSFSPIEPRLGLSYTAGRGHKFSLGGGLHSQIQSPYLYFYGPTEINGDPQENNRDMGLSKSLHSVLSYDYVFARKIRLKAEIYHQYLYQIPVSVRTSSFSVLNAGTGFARLFPEALENTGTGRNYGLELTLEKFFSKGYYFLATGSLFDAKYKGSDGVLRNTVYNGRFAFNGLFAKEFKFGQGSAFNIGGKLTYVGGRWYGPVDDSLSVIQSEIIYVDETVNTQQFRPYFRADLKTAITWNRPKVSHELAIDFVNLLDTQNILTLTYVPEHPSGNPIQEEYQLGFLPLFYYKIDF